MQVIEVGEDPRIKVGHHNDVKNAAYVAIVREAPRFVFFEIRYQDI